MTSIFADEHNCPRCGGGVPNDAERGAYPGALSRWDDRSVEVCSACGQDEALIQWAAELDGRDSNEAVHPVNGRVPWVTVPTGI